MKAKAQSKSIVAATAHQQPTTPTETLAARPVPQSEYRCSSDRVRGDMTVEPMLLKLNRLGVAEVTLELQSPFSGNQTAVLCPVPCSSREGAVNQQFVDRLGCLLAYLLYGMTWNDKCHSATAPGHSTPHLCTWGPKPQSPKTTDLSPHATRIKPGTPRSKSHEPEILNMTRMATLKAPIMMSCSCHPGATSGPCHARSMPSGDLKPIAL